MSIDVDVEGLNFKELLKKIEYRNVGGDDCQKEIDFLRKLQERIESGLENQIHPNKVILRADKAGVFFGELVEKNGLEVKMKNVRKLFNWHGAAAVEQLAVDGVANPDKCKFTVVVIEMLVGGYDQIIPCTYKAVASIEAVKPWQI